MAKEEGLTEFMEQRGLVMRICDGALTICNGDCENCGDDEELDEFLVEV